MAVKKIVVILSIINLIYSVWFFNTSNSITDYSYAETGNQSINYCYKLQWGSDGTDDGQFLRPHDVVFDSQGYVYVNDRERNDVQKFTKDGEFISRFGEKGEDLGEFKSPYSMVIDSNDHLYIIDRGNDRVQKLFTNGTPIAAWDSAQGPPVLYGKEENEENNDDDQTEQNVQVKDQFASPEDMALDRHGNFYLTDTGNDRIIKYDSNFNFVSQFGISGIQPSQFIHPHGIGVDSKGNIFINELESPRIQKFTNNGTFVKQWGSNGTGPGQLTLPLEHLEVDFTDKIFMVDSATNPRVQVFDTNGTLLTSFGKYGIGNAEFKKPEHVTVDSNGDVYVVDRGNQRIQVFSPC
ncbi:MAG: 6-bladed beta-propeller [Nitrososphaeraceae archaeon]